MCFIAKSYTAAAIAASNNTCAITDSNRIFYSRCTFTKCDSVLCYTSISAA